MNVTNKSRNITSLGQVFTPACVVDAMLKLRQNTGRVLEPSCGDGSFSNRLPDCVSIEIEKTLAPRKSLILDFFAYTEDEKFATIIGNPPYVRYRDIRTNTRELIKSQLFDLRANLYLFFIEKCVRHLNDSGELIFITPRDFLKTTSSVHLNKWLRAQGTITHAIGLGDARVFSMAVPNCLIWRFEKNCFNRTMKYAEISNRDNLAMSLKTPKWQTRCFVEAAGHLMFSRHHHEIHMKDIATVKVGAVSGADDIYANEEQGTLDFVFSQTIKTGKTRRMIWVDKGDPPPACLKPHKNRLMSRSVRSFGEANWWHWGRSFPATIAPRVYVNGKTRQAKPFFIHPCRNFDGSILAIFPLRLDIDLQKFCRALNSLAWDQLGFVCDGRFLFSQRSLENALLPKSFKQFVPVDEHKSASKKKPKTFLNAHIKTSIRKAQRS